MAGEEAGSPYSQVASHYSPSKSPFYPMPQKAPHIGHNHHLCEICERGDCSLEEVKSLVKDAKFICKVCGRTAVAEENLCEPVAL